MLECLPHLTLLNFHTKKDKERIINNKGACEQRGTLHPLESGKKLGERRISKIPRHLEGLEKGCILSVLGPAKC